MDAAAAAELQAAAVLACGWLLAYLAVRHVLCRSFSPDGANRVISFLHALVGFALSTRAIDFSRLREDVGTPATNAQLSALVVSLGYFVYDTFCCLAIELTAGKVDVATLLHHVATVAGLVVGVTRRTSGHELLMCLALMEVANPFMHLRSILREAGLGKSTLADVNDVVFALLFLFSRCIVGAPVVYWTVTSSRTPFLVKVGGLGILGVSWFWARKLVLIIVRKTRKAGGEGKRS